MLEIYSFTFNPFQENTYVLFDDTLNAVVIDPGCSDADERAEIADFIDQKKLRVVMLLNTHCHVDHVLGNYFIKEKYKVKLWIHRNDEPVLKAVKVYAPNYGIPDYSEATPDEYLEEGQTIKFGNTELKVLFVPGHSPGHVAFYHEESKSVISGDVLFYNSIGRTDLPGGNFNMLIESIHKKLFTLPNETRVFPGHGPATTIETEKRANPFCAIEQVSR
jgi:hydroxyacylglutathione hydrolase